MLNIVLLVRIFLSTGYFVKTESYRIAKDICKSRCFCEEKDNSLNIDCENKGFTTVNQYHPPPNKISLLFLDGNSLSRLRPGEFVHYTNVTSLHLGNNGLQEIKTGAFAGLFFLKRLHLNNNNLEVLKEGTFAGLEGLEYLQADYNYIREIEAGAFSKLNKLKVLILNDNLLPSLPSNVFRFVLLTHLDLRGNRLKTLPFVGVLEHIGGIMEIQLEENPWNCTCELVPLTAWLYTISGFAGDVVCETPFRLHGKDVTQLVRQEFCPRKNVVDASHHALKPPSDSQYQPPTSRGSPKVSRPPKARNDPADGLPSPGKGNQIFGPIMVHHTRSSMAITCPAICVCASQNPDSGLIVNCQEKQLHNISQLYPKPSYPKKLHLTANYLQTIYRTDLAEYSSLELLHLGNNGIAVIQDGAFHNLTVLRRLYLNGNLIESLSPLVFEGLRSLQYLYLEYNILKNILPHTFNSLKNLQLLFLNNNLLRSLPENVFRGTVLTRLNLRNNHFSHLRVRGVLDQLSALIQIDLQENPWDCTCGIVEMKRWMELSSAVVVVNELTCDSPSKRAGRLLTSLRNDDICPETNVLTDSPVYTIRATTGGVSEMYSEVPVSVLILGLLVVFILSVCFGAGIFVLMLKKSKAAKRPPARANNFDLSTFHVQCSSYSSETNRDLPERNLYNNIPPPVGRMSQKPIQLQNSDGQFAYYRNMKEIRPNMDYKKNARSRNPSCYTLSTPELIGGNPNSQLLYKNATERANKLPTTGEPNYNIFSTPKKSTTPYESTMLQNQGRFNKPTPSWNPRKCVIQSKNNHLIRPGRLNRVPDYLEVLEKYTTTSHL